MTTTTEKFLMLTKHDKNKDIVFNGKEMYDDGSCWRYIANKNCLYWDEGLSSYCEIKQSCVLREIKDYELNQAINDYNIDINS